MAVASLLTEAADPKATGTGAGPGAPLVYTVLGRITLNGELDQVTLFHCCHHKVIITFSEYV